MHVPPWVRSALGLCPQRPGPDLRLWWDPLGCSPRPEPLPMSVPLFAHAVLATSGPAERQNSLMGTLPAPPAPPPFLCPIRRWLGQLPLLCTLCKPPVTTPLATHTPQTAPLPLVGYTWSKKGLKPEPCGSSLSLRRPAHVGPVPRCSSCSPCSLDALHMRSLLPSQPGGLFPPFWGLALQR